MSDVEQTDSLNRPGVWLSSAGSSPQFGTTGMNSTFKIAVPILLLIAVIFGVTYITQYTPSTPEDGGDGKGPDAAGNEPPLRFGNSTRAWDPPDMVSADLGVKYRGLPLMAPSANPNRAEDPFSFSLQDRIFPAYFEPGETLHSTAFWFENRHPKRVTMQLMRVSCSSCSGGRIAAIPPDVTRQVLQMTAISGLPQGLFTGLPVGMVGPGAALAPDRLTWEQHTYQLEKNPTYTIPAANDTDGWSPQWGILELQFKVSTIGPRDPLVARFITEVEGGPAGENTFVIAYEGANGFDVTPTRIEVGEVTGNSESRSFDVVVYSSTRDLGDPRGIQASVRLPTGAIDTSQFITVTPAVCVPQLDLPAFTDELVRQLRKPLRIESAYKMSVQVNPRVGDARIDIGLLERDLWVVVPGAQERRVKLIGLVRGPIWLANDRTDIDLFDYPAGGGRAGKVQLITEQPGAEVVLIGVEGEAADFFKVTLEKQPPSADRGYYDLKYTIAPGARTGRWSGVVVLEIKGTYPQKLRIPVKGNGQLGR